MSRKFVERKDVGPYHVTCRCINREWFNLSMDQVWKIFSHQLYFARHAFNIRIHSFVLMSNHYHLIVSTPQINLSEAMAYFQREVSRDLNREGNRINQTFGSRYRPCLLNTEHYFLNAYKYVYQNPIRAGLVKTAEAYPYSTLHGLMGRAHLIIPVEEDTILFGGDLSLNLKWINNASSVEDSEAMRKALRREVFALPRDLKNSLPHRLESELF